MRTLRVLTKEDINLIIDYFLNASPAFLKAMGADIKKLPTREKWHKIILDDLNLPLHKKTFFYVIWQVDNIPVGHSNINKIKFRDEAYMHLHIWTTAHRHRGNGLYFIKESLKYYFDKFELKKIYCEPHAGNPAPNKTLPKAGFRFVKQYETTPGWINFRQMVNQWELPAALFKN